MFPDYFSISCDYDITAMYKDDLVIKSVNQSIK